MPSKKFFLFVLLFICTIPLFSKDALHPVIISKHFSTSEGLNSKTVYAIVQDPNGFLWFATDGGAFRYDGNEFKQYTVQDGLSDNEILQLFVDSKGRVWFLTYNGYLSFYFKGKIYNESNAPFLKSTYIGGSFVNANEHDGEIWFSSFKYGFVSIRDTIVNKKMLAIDDRYRSYPYMAKKGDAYWFFKYQELFNFKNHNDSIHITDFPFAFSSISGFDDILFVNTKGIYRVTDLDVKPYLLGTLTPNHYKIVSMVYEKDLDNIWICTLGNGCLLYHNKKFVKSYLPNASVTNVMHDREGNVWISTMNDGVYVYYQNNNYITNFDKSSGLPDSKVYSLAIDNDKNLWLGFYNGIADKISGINYNEFQFETPNRADYLRTMSILPVGDTVWFANDGGIYFVEKDKIHRVVYPDLTAAVNNYSVKHLSADFNGNIYGAFSFNLLKVHKENPKGYYADVVFDSLIRVFSSVCTPDGRIYVASIKGLCEYRPGKYLKKISQDFDFSKVRILDMKLDRNGDLLLATNVSGVFVLRNSRLIDNITTKNNLSDNNCRKLFIEDSLLYVCTQNGLSIFSRQDDKWIFKDKINTRDGLLDNSINDVAISDSLIYIATDGGVSIVNKNVFSATHYIRNINISEVILDKPYELSDNSFEFESTTPRFIVKFSYPVYNPANKVKFRYRLRKQNQDVEWLNTTNNEIQFSSLEPGNYIFEVMPYFSSRRAGISSLNIFVKPMWWQTTVARIFAIALTLLIVIFASKRWTRIQFEKRLQTLKEKEAIEAERNRIASDMHDDIGADLTQISIWTNVLKSNSVDTKRLITKISLLSKEILSKMDQIIWALNSVHNHSTDMVVYLHEYATEYLEDNNINLDFKIQQEIPEAVMSASKRRNIFLVLKELLHNTVKHSGASAVIISISFDRNYMILEYGDNGIGIARNENSFGLGFHSMMSRMSEINSTLEINPNAEEGMSVILKIILVEETTNV